MNLILIRHAKSSWDFDVCDKERPLSKRGITDAQLVFNELKVSLSKSITIWCSTAKRTRQTAQLFCSICAYNFDDIEFKNELYTFSNVDLEKIINSNVAENLIIFGHNNAITDFVHKFGNYYIDNVPTCGVVMLKFENSNAFQTKKGVITKTIFPRDLKNDRH